VGPFNVQVNALGPGFIVTDLNANLEDPHGGWVEDRPRRTPGPARDLIGAAIFLSSAASDFMTGQVSTSTAAFKRRFPVAPEDPR